MKKIIITTLIILITVVPFSVMAIDYTIDKETGIKLYELPNGVKDEIIDGKLMKRVSDIYEIKETDIKQLFERAEKSQVTFDTKVLSNFLPIATTLVEGKISIDGYSEINYNIETTPQEKAWAGVATNKLIYFDFPLGTTIQQARSELAGIALSYQLETPIIENIGSRVGEYKIKIIINEGMLHIKNIANGAVKTITEFFYNGEDITPRSYLFMAYFATVFCISILAVFIRR